LDGVLDLDVGAAGEWAADIYNTSADRDSNGLTIDTTAQDSIALEVNAEALSVATFASKNIVLTPPIKCENSATIDGSLVVNEDSGSSGDFRWESNSNAYGIFGDASAETVAFFSTKYKFYSTYFDVNERIDIYDNTTDALITGRQDGSGDIMLLKDGTTEVLSIEDDGKMTHTPTGTQSIYTLGPYDARRYGVVAGSSPVYVGFSSLGGDSYAWVSENATGTKSFEFPINVPAYLYGASMRVRKIVVQVYKENTTSYLASAYLYSNPTSGGWRDIWNSTTGWGSGSASGMYEYTVYNSTGINLNYDEPFFLELNLSNSSGYGAKIVAARIEYERV
jgi:hypothetical protein